MNWDEFKTELNEDNHAWNIVQDVAKNHQAQNVKFKGGKSIKLDAYSASALVAVHKALSSKMKKKFIKNINHSPQGLKSMVDFSFKISLGEGLDEATNTRVVINVDRTGYYVLKKKMAGLSSFTGASSYNVARKEATFHFDAKKHDNTERGKVAGIIKKMKGAEFHHSMTEDSELNEVKTRSLTNPMKPAGETEFAVVAKASGMLIKAFPKEEHARMYIKNQYGQRKNLRGNLGIIEVPKSRAPGNQMRKYGDIEVVKESVLLEGDLSDIIGNAILKSKKIKKGAKESDIISAINNELRNKKKPKLSRNAIAFWMRDRDFLADTLGFVRRGLKESVEQLDEYGVHTQKTGGEHHPSSGKYAIKLPKSAEGRSKRQKQIIRNAMANNRARKTRTLTNPMTSEEAKFPPDTPKSKATQKAIASLGDRISKARDLEGNLTAWEADKLFGKSKEQKNEYIRKRDAKKESKK